MAAPGSARFKRSAATTSRSFTWTGHSELETNLQRKRGKLRLLETKKPRKFMGILEGASLITIYICMQAIGEGRKHT